MEQYYERKARKGGAIRICDTTNCTTPLSRYNEGKICRKCEAEQEREARQKIIRILT